MSKRSFRRLAVVAGVALAVGSTAPAMAVRIDGAAIGDADVSVDTVDISDVSLPQVTQVLPTGLVLGTAGSLVGTVQGVAGSAVPVVLGTVGDVTGGVTCLAGVGIGTALGLGLTAVADVNVGLGGVAAGASVLSGVLGAPFAVVDGAGDCALGLADGALDTVGDVQTIAGGITATAVVTATGAVGTVTQLPGTVLTTATGLLATPALGSILNIHAEGDVNVLASLLGSL